MDVGNSEAIKGAKRLGVRVGNWLSAEQSIGCKQRLQNAVNDQMGLEPEPPTEELDHHSSRILL
jgi:hypothetical protein